MNEGLNKSYKYIERTNWGEGVTDVLGKVVSVSKVFNMYSTEILKGHRYIFYRVYAFPIGFMQRPYDFDFLYVHLYIYNHTHTCNSLTYT